MLRRMRHVGEWLLAGAIGGWLNARVLAAKRRRLARQVGADRLAGPDVIVNPGFFKQHTVSHRTEILGRFAHRLVELGLDPSVAKTVLF